MTEEIDTYEQELIRHLNSNHREDSKLILPSERKKYDKNGHLRPRKYKKRKA